MDKRLKDTFDLLELERAVIFEMLDNISLDKLQEKPSEDSWSVIQVLDHMLEVERASLFYLKKKIKAGDQIPNASWTSSFRTFILITFLNSPVKYKAPKGLKHPRNDKDLGEMLHIWNAVRKDIIKFLEEYPEQFKHKAIYRHPVSGRIRLDQTMQFFRAHQRHHKAQIVRTLNKVNG